MNNLNEIFVATKEKEYVLAKIEGLGQKFYNQKAINEKQWKALFRNYCHETVEIFDECFEPTMLGISKYKKKVEKFQKHDNVNIDAATLEIVKILVDLKEIVSSMVPINELPSCKSLVGLSAEDIVAKAEDLVKSDIVKVGVGALLLGSKINDVVKIEDVKDYYQGNLEELQNEIKIKKDQGEPTSLIEQFLLDKFNAEIAYCNLALVKAGISVTKELKDMAEIGKKHIAKYEQNYSVWSRSLVLSKNVEC